jgi:hypothetical protein
MPLLVLVPLLSLKLVELLKVFAGLVLLLAVFVESVALLLVFV